MLIKKMQKNTLFTSKHKNNLDIYIIKMYNWKKGFKWIIERNLRIKNLWKS
jgi:hypothetical protein